MKIETIKKIGIDSGLAGLKLDLFVDFMSSRFPKIDERAVIYVTDWSKRFMTDKPESFMDAVSQIIYRRIQEAVRF